MQKAVKATVNTNSPYLHKYIFIYLWFAYVYTSYIIYLMQINKFLHQYILY